MRSYVGLDVHSKTSVYLIQDERGQERGRGEVPTSREGFGVMRARHELAPGTPVALEAGTTAFFAARELRECGFLPLVVDAREVRLKAHRPTQKSDSRDARALCDGVRTGTYRAIVHVPPEAIILLRESLSRRRHFVRAQTAEVNAAKRLLRSIGRTPAPGRLQTEKGWERLLEALVDQPPLRSFIEQHRTAWRVAGEQVVLLDHALRDQRGAFCSEIARLRTVPGVGEITALTAIAAFSDVTRFPDAKHAASYAGLVPRTWHTGDREAYGRITKRGSPELRAMLCEAAHQAWRANHPLHPFLRKVAARTGYKKAVVAVAHRLCRILFAMLRHGVDFDPTKLGLEKGPFEKTTTRLYRLNPKKK